MSFSSLDSFFDRLNIQFQLVSNVSLLLCLLLFQAPFMHFLFQQTVESELRDLSPEEIANLKTAALLQEEEGACVSDLDPKAVAALHHRGLIYFEVPIQPEDRFIIPPLEGFGE
jgi:hypothetical protein